MVKPGALGNPPPAHSGRSVSLCYRPQNPPNFNTAAAAGNVAADGVDLSEGVICGGDQSRGTSGERVAAPTNASNAPNRTRHFGARSTNFPPSSLRLVGHVRSRLFCRAPAHHLAQFSGVMDGFAWWHVLALDAVCAAAGSDLPDRHYHQRAGDSGAVADAGDGPAAGGKHHAGGHHPADDDLCPHSVGIQRLSLVAVGHHFGPTGAQRGDDPTDSDPCRNARHDGGRRRGQEFWRVRGRGQDRRRADHLRHHRGDPIRGHHQRRHAHQRSRRTLSPWTACPAGRWPSTPI